MFKTDYQGGVKYLLDYKIVYCYTHIWCMGPNIHVLAEFNDNNRETNYFVYILIIDLYSFTIKYNHVYVD